MAGSTNGIANLADQARAITNDVWAWLRAESLEAALAAGAVALIYLGLETVRHLAGRHRLQRDAAGPVTWRSILDRLLVRTHGWFLLALAVELVARSVAPEGDVRTAIDFLFTIAAVVQGAIWVRELVLGLIERRAGPDEDHAVLASAMGIIRLLVNVVVWVLAIILVLDNLGVNVTALVAGLGVGGIAIGLAAQGIFSDLFAALAIIFDRPFRVGDTIQFGQTQGTVEAIGLKTTRLRADSGEQVIVSNTELLKREIRVLRRIEERRVFFVLPLALGNAADAVAAAPGQVRAAVESLDGTRFDHAHLTAIGSTSIDLGVELYVTVAEVETMREVREAAIVAALRALDSAGVVLADLTPPRTPG